MSGQSEEGLTTRNPRGGPLTPNTRHPPPLVIAHRGASGSEHENSLAAFRRARELNADGVELDIHSTRDGALLVHHDPELPGLGPIGSLTRSTAHAFRLPNGEGVPFLAEALEVLDDLEVWIEAKSLDAAFDEHLFDTIDGSRFPERRAVHSFDHRIVARLGTRRPRLKRGALMASYLLDPIHVLDGVGAETLWQEAHLIDGDLVERLHRAGRKIIAWTVNTDAEAERLTRLGVDGLCGNYPDRLRAAVDRSAR